MLINIFLIKKLEKKRRENEEKNNIRVIFHFEAAQNIHFKIIILRGDIDEYFIILT